MLRGKKVIRADEVQEGPPEETHEILVESKRTGVVVSLVFVFSPR